MSKVIMGVFMSEAKQFQAAKASAFANSPGLPIPTIPGTGIQLPRWKTAMMMPPQMILSKVG